MKFETKMSGTRVTDFSIKEIFDSQYITLTECLEKIHRQETMNYLLDTFRFTLSDDGKIWFAIIDWDTNYKIAILEKYPEYEKEMIDYFGDNWLNHYIRFNH